MSGVGEIDQKKILLVERVLYCFYEPKHMIVANNLIAFGKNGCTGEELAAKLKLPQKVVQSYLLSDLLRDKIIKQEAKNLEEDMELDDGRDYNKLSYQQKVVYRSTCTVPSTLTKGSIHNHHLTVVVVNIRYNAKKQ